MQINASNEAESPQSADETLAGAGGMPLSAGNGGI
jgi:hypothetical protein